MGLKALLGRLTKLESSPGTRCWAMRRALSAPSIGAGRPSDISGALSWEMIAGIGRLAKLIWLSARIAWIRNQVPVMEITAINQIDQMPLSRWKSPQKIRAPWLKRRVGLKKPFQKRLYTTSPVTSDASSGSPSSDTRYQPQL